MFRNTLPFLVAALTPAAALAHPGHDPGGIAAGLAHPLGGADHLLAMISLGLLAAQRGGRATWALPAGFVGAMLAGGALGAAGVPLPAVEPAILASAIVIGAMVAGALRPPMAATLAGAALFGLAHGWAHGAEAPSGALLPFMAGFALATAALHGFGILAGRAIPAMLLRGAGAAATLAGLMLAVAG